jgi:hypothetical protein
VTAAPGSVRAGALTAALLARPGDSRLRRLALAAVLVLVGGALALCCCVDGPEHSATGGTAAVAAGQHAGPAGIPSGASAQAGEHADRQIGVPERCGSPATTGEASPASTGRAMLTAAGALAVVATSQPVSPLLTGARAQLLDHFSARVSPYRLCVMRT